MEEELNEICERIALSQYVINYSSLYYSRDLNYCEKLILSILMYHYDSYPKDDKGYCKYSYDYVLGLTRNEIEYTLQDYMMLKLTKMKLVDVKFYRHKIHKFIPSLDKIKIILRDSDTEMRDKFTMTGRYAVEKPIKKIIYKTYIIEDEHTHLFKIGRSRDVSTRYKTLQSTAPLLKLIMKSEKDCEKILHKKFKDNRIRGEWFSLEKSDLDLLLSEFNFKLCQNEK